MILSLIVCVIVLVLSMGSVLGSVVLNGVMWVFVLLLYVDVVLLNSFDCVVSCVWILMFMMVLCVGDVVVDSVWCVCVNVWCVCEMSVCVGVGMSRRVARFVVRFRDASMKLKKMMCGIDWLCVDYILFDVLLCLFLCVFVVCVCVCFFRAFRFVSFRAFTRWF